MKASAKQPHKYAPYPQPAGKPPRTSPVSGASPSWGRIATNRPCYPLLILTRYKIQALPASRPTAAIANTPRTSVTSGTPVTPNTPVTPRPSTIPDAPVTPRPTATTTANPSTSSEREVSTSSPTVAELAAATHLVRNKQLHDWFMAGKYNAFNATIINYLASNSCGHLMRRNDLMCEQRYKDVPACMAFVHLYRGLRSLYPELPYLYQLLIDPVRFIRCVTKIQPLPNNIAKMLKSLQAGNLLIQAFLYTGVLLGKSNKLLFPADNSDQLTTSDGKLRLLRPRKKYKCFVSLNVMYTDAAQAVSALLAINQVLDDVVEGSFSGIFPEDFPARFFIQLKRRTGPGQDTPLDMANTLIRQTLLTGLPQDTLQSMILALADNNLELFEHVIRTMVMAMRNDTPDMESSPSCGDFSDTEDDNPATPPA